MKRLNLIKLVLANIILWIIPIIVICISNNIRFNFIFISSYAFILFIFNLYIVGGVNEE